MGVRDDQRFKDKKKEQKAINLERGPADTSLGGGRSWEPLRESIPMQAWKVGRLDRPCITEQQPRLGTAY